MKCLLCAGIARWWHTRGGASARAVGSVFYRFDNNVTIYTIAFKNKSKKYKILSDSTLIFVCLIKKRIDIQMSKEKRIKYTNVWNKKYSNALSAISLEMYVLRP
jgi:hypothetical protein